MTIAKTTSKVQYGGDGVTKAFAVPFRFFADADLEVYVTVDATGVQTKKSLTTDYTVINNGDETGGTVTMVLTPATGETITVVRNVPETQSTDYAANDAFPAETHETALDRLTLLVQGVSERVDRAMLAQESDTATLDLPSQVARASKYLAFDASSAPIAATPPEGGNVVSAFMATVLDDPDAATARQTLFANFYVVSTTDLGFVHGDSSASAKSTNDAAWAAFKAAASGGPAMLLVDGVIHGANGFHLLDWLSPIAIVGTVSGAGFTVETDSTIPLRIRGVLGGKYTPGVHLVNITCTGGWSANNYSSGSQPYSGIPNEATWVYASAIEVLYAADVRIIDCVAQDSQYDGISLPLAINGAEILRTKTSVCADDGFNPGGQTPVNTEDFVKGVRIRNCYAEYSFNTGIHISGGADGAVVTGCTVRRCGKAAFDMSAGSGTFIDCYGYEIGQPDRSDPIFADYPGDSTNVDGFYDVSGGATAARGFSLPTTTYVKRLTIQNMRIENLFDRDDRDMAFCHLNGINNSDAIISIEGFSGNNTGQNATYYSSGTVAPLYTGVSAHSVARGNIGLSAVFSSTNRGGRSQFNMGNTKIDVDIEEVGSTESAMVLSSDVVISGSITATGYFDMRADAEIDGLKITNAAPNATTTKRGVYLQAQSTKIKRLEVVDFYLQATSSGNDSIIERLILRGTGNQRPLLLDMRYAGTGTVINNLEIYQEALAGGVTGEASIQVRVADIVIGNLIGYDKATASVSIYLDNAAATGFRICGGRFESSRVLLKEAVAAGTGEVTNLSLASNLTAGTEIDLTGDGQIVQGCTIRRATSYTTSPIELNGNNSAVAYNVGANLGAGLVNNLGTGNDVANNVTI